MNQCRNCGMELMGGRSICNRKCERELFKKNNQKCDECGEDNEGCVYICKYSLNCFICGQECHKFKDFEHKCNCTYCYGEKPRAVEYPIRPCKHCGEYLEVNHNGFCGDICEVEGKKRN